MKKDKAYPRIAWDTEPYPLQQEIIDYLEGRVLNSQGERYRFLFAILGRQSGKSWLAKRVLLERAVNQRQRCLWVAPTVKNAKHHWNELKDWLDTAGFPIKRIQEQHMEIYFHGGGYIFVRTVQEPDNMRGPTIDFMVLDEAAFFPTGEYVWNSICVPMVTASRGQILVATTPNTRDWLYRLYLRGLESDSRYHKSWTMPSHMSPYQDPELLEEQRKSMPSSQYRREYLAEFLADGGGIFMGVEEASTVPFASYSDPSDVLFTIAGLDFGFNDDFSTFTLREVLKDGRSRQVYGRRWSETGTIQTVNNVLSEINRFKPRYVVMESNGIGGTLLSLMRELAKGENINVRKEFEDAFEGRYGSMETAEPATRGLNLNGTRLIAIHMDNATKRRLVEATAADIEYGRLDLLDDQNEYGQVQQSELGTYLRQSTRQGYDITYNAAEGSHDDTVSALYLTQYAVPKRPSIYKRKEDPIKPPKKAKSIFKQGKSLRKLLKDA